MAIIIFYRRRRARGLSLQKVRFLKVKDMICVSQNVFVEERTRVN